MEITRIFDFLPNLQQLVPDKEDILAKKTRSGWIKYSVKDYVEFSHATARGILALGYQKGTKVITITPNCPEWNFIDMGSTLAGMVHVPIYPTLSNDEFHFIINHSDSELIFVGTVALYNKIAPIIQSISRDIKLIPIYDTSDSFCFKNLIELGNGERKDELEEIVNTNIKEISPDECASIVYTSGTTGMMKGVMLSHRNLTFDSHSHAVRMPKTWKNKFVSFLPLCHTYERTMNYDYQECGISIYYAESLGTFASDLADCHGDGFCAVPRVLEMMYGKFESAGKNLKGLAKHIYAWAWDFANKFDFYNRKPFYLLQLKIADKLVYSKWRNSLGGHDMIVVSGGSSIQEKIIRCFNAAQLRIFEGYGMTEASPVIAVNNPNANVNIIGTVGTVIEGTTVKFANDGEILTKGPHVMMGYYKNPEKTAEVIDSEGFLHTGDIGCMVDGKYLKITDRKKEIFKLSNGKYIAPQAIEKLINQSSLFDNSLVIGENQKFASAIISVNHSNVMNMAKRMGASCSTVAEALKDPAIIEALHNEVTKSNATLATYELVKRERFVADEWTTSNGLLSQTLKLKRTKLLSKYSALVSDIFS